MKSIGLQPSSTGMVGGKETGQKMMDYIILDGPFTKAFAKLAATGWRLNLQSAHRPAAKGAVNSKTKFTCSQCGQNACGKPDLAITYFYSPGGYLVKINGLRSRPSATMLGCTKRRFLALVTILS
jgi:hypothetical protein